MRVVTKIHRGGESDRKLHPRFETTSVILVLMMSSFGIVPRSFAAGWGVRSNASSRYAKSSVDNQVKTLSGQLNLTADQRIKVKKIIEIRQARLAQIRRDSSMSAVNRFNLMRSVHDTSNKKIRSLLNEEQTKKFDELTHYRLAPKSPSVAPSPAPQPEGSSH